MPEQLLFKKIKNKMTKNNNFKFSKIYIPNIDITSVRKDARSYTPTTVFNKKEFKELTASEFAIILGTFFSLVSSINIRSGAYLKLPFRLGEIGILKKRAIPKK